MNKPFDRTVAWPETDQAAASEILQASDPDVLNRIGQPGVGAVIWQRWWPDAFRNWIETLPADRLPSLRETVRVADVGLCVQRACDRVDLGGHPLAEGFTADVAALGYSFAEMLGCRTLNLRLDVVETDACSRFHVDNVQARLLCTYRGAGTQFALGAPGSDPVAPVTDAPTGAVSVLRGTRWPGRELPGVLHRSPPISGLGRTRLLLVIDPGDAPDPILH